MSGDLEDYRRRGRLDGNEVALSLTKEFLLDPDFDVAAFEMERVAVLVERLKTILDAGTDFELAEAYVEACCKAFESSLRERIAIAKNSSEGPRG